MNQKGFASIILILAIIILAGAAGYFVLNQKSSAPAPVFSPTPSPAPATAPTPVSTPAPAPTSTPSSQTPPSDETVNWKTYRNEEYGFEFKYPPTYTLSQETARDPDLLSLRIRDVGVRITKKTGLGFSGVACDSSVYDSKLNAWLSVENNCRPKSIYYNLVCPNAKIGHNALLTYQTGTGDAGSSISVNYLLTDKDYAVVLSRSNNEGDTPEGSMRNQEKILQNFRLLDGVGAISSICDIAKIGTPTSLPAIASPNTGSAIKISQSFDVTLSQDLPSGVGAAVFISENSHAISYPPLFGELTSGHSLSLRPLSQFLYRTRIPDFAGDAYLYIKFYKRENGKKIFFGASGQQVIKLSINNDLPSIFELNIDEAVARNYSKKDGKIVLKKGSFTVNNGIMKITASNVRACVRTVTSENNGSPAAMGAIEDGSADVYIPPAFPSSQPIVVTYTCKTPAGAEIVRVLNFISE